MSSGEMQANGETVRDLYRALGLGRDGLATARSLVLVATRDAAWQEFAVPGTGETVRYSPGDFVRFVRAQPLEGLGMSLDALRALFHDDPTVIDAIDAAVQRKNGVRGPGKAVDNVHTLPPRPAGNSQENALRRLRKGRPDLHEMVLNGELSAHAAAIEAGFRRRDSPLDQLHKAWARASAEERATFWQTLAAQLATGPAEGEREGAF
jgi:hypothetical protein